MLFAHEIFQESYVICIRILSKFCKRKRVDAEEWVLCSHGCIVVRIPDHWTRVRPFSMNGTKRHSHYGTRQGSIFPLNSFHSSLACYKRTEFKRIDRNPTRMTGLRFVCTDIPVNINGYERENQCWMNYFNINMPSRIY